MKQIDFNKLFMQKEYIPLKYTLRTNSNGRHDIVFLNSYLHDATFLLKELSFSKKKLTIPLKRIAWELFATSNTLPIYNSILLFFNVIDYNYIINHTMLRKEKLPYKIEINNFEVIYCEKTILIKLSSMLATGKTGFELSVLLKRDSKKYLTLLDDLN